ncbi:hypothetical protein [Aeromicrobium sp. Leaf291]|uniref:hypothetical protein n=1 Tax=Aeromicrobium sp. Leaf291 TaxID=1736325 RepID=UPI0006F3AE21|nr:hypothetical protein [Aeromicrobium sp. Leaf291]KQP81604.1 hypothetical protein ASF35_16365 [Aeromicrobium sp. Leaf291]
MTTSRPHRTAAEFRAQAPAAANARCIDHGLAVADCAACTRYAGECDLGGCTRPATHVGELVVDGVVLEGRPVCRRDTRFARSLGLRVRPVR